MLLKQSQLKCRAQGHGDSTERRVVFIHSFGRLPVKNSTPLGNRCPWYIWKCRLPSATHTHSQGSTATHHVYEPDLAPSSCLPYGWFLPAVHTLQAKHTALGECVCVSVCVKVGEREGECGEEREEANIEREKSDMFYHKATFNIVFIDKLHFKLAVCMSKTKLVFLTLGATNWFSFLACVKKRLVCVSCDFDLGMWILQQKKIKESWRLGFLFNMHERFLTRLHVALTDHWETGCNDTNVFFFNV